MIRIVGSAAPAAETKLDSLYGDVEAQSRGLGTIYEEDQAYKPKTLL